MSSPTKFCVLSLLLGLCVSLSGAQTVSITSDQSIQIGRQVYYFRDRSAALTMRDVVHAGNAIKFIPSDEETLNFGATSDVCWVKFSYTHNDSVQHFLAIGNTNLSEVEAFVFFGDSLVHQQRAGLESARVSPNANLDLNAWLLRMPVPPAHLSATMFLKVRDSRRVILPLEITTLSSVIRKTHKEDFLFGLYFGCLAIIATLNVYFFFYFRESVYVFYGGHILCQILINGILKGYLLTLFGSTLFFLSPYVPALAGVSNIFVILFTLVFLDVEKSLPQWYRPTLFLIVLPVLNTLFNVFGFFTLSAVLGTYIGILVCVWLFMLGLIAYAHKVMQARFYIVGWGAFFLGILILNSALNQWLEINWFTLNAALYGTLLEVLLISFALADRINLIRIGRKVERVQRLALIEQQNQWLEENVKLRTVELTQKNNEIESQNEELRQQHEELTTTHELLEKQKTLVEERNRDIGAMNQNLEQKVNQRTLELEETVRNLIRQNHDLEQFSYIVSHNMRAPVARILGLIQLLNLDHDRDEHAQLMEFLKESTMGLDEIIHDLSQIIDLRRGSEMITEKVDLEKIIYHNLSDLTDEIKKADAVVAVKIGVRELTSVKSYMQSIFYNLISNAIKYRDPERTLRIEISTTETPDQVIIEVEDNGLGINTPPEKVHEIFHLYKRTYTHVHGKGLGLYIVKTQVDALRGNIEVQSTYGEGSRFRVTINK